MKKVCLLITSILMISALSGCDKVGGEVALVKNGTLEMDKSLTVGKAIDNYKYFKDTKWELLTTDNGKKLVQATGNIDTGTHPTLNSAAGIKSMFIEFQFKVNLDKTFEVAWCGVGVEKNDGSKVDPEQRTNINSCINSLKSIYNNEDDI